MRPNEDVAAVSIMTRNYNEMERDLAAVSNKMAVTFLRISQTQIVELKRYILHDFTNLTDLDLSNCSICSFEDGVFESLRRLRSLNLSSNVINVVNGELFATNSELLTINLTNNIIDTINQISFSNLNKLLILDLSYNQISGLQNHCFSNPNLKYLYLNDNQIVNVAPSAFYGVPNLTYLSLDNNEIKNLESAIFKKSVNLKFLGLSNNKIKVIWYNVFWKLTELDTLHLQNNCLTQAITESILCENLALTNLDLSGNLISGVEKNAFDSCRNLKCFKMSVSGIFKFISLRHLKSLTNFELIYTPSEHLTLTRCFWDMFKPKTCLTVLKLIIDKVVVISLCRFHQLINLELLHIEVIQPNDSVRDIPIHTNFEKMPKLKKVTLKKLNYFTILKSSYTEQNFTYLDVTGIKNNIISNTFRKFSQLKYLNLSFSEIKVISNLAFETLVNLEHLDLQYSQITSIKSMLFNYNSQLRLLNCSNCRIYSIDDFSFANLRNLETLDLRNNFFNRNSQNLFSGLNTYKCNILL